MSGKIVAGVIQHPDSPDPNLTLNDDGTVDLFGGEGLGDVVGPASATDNALVRFNGTGGKTVQNSGITVDDSGFVTSNLTISNTTPLFQMIGTGSPSLEITAGASGTYARLFFLRTGASARWAMFMDTAAESSGAVGSDLVFRRYDDAGNSLGDPLKITRSTGKATLGSVGATAGLELGSSGPRVMSGTGSPEGVVAAPVGSRWIRTDGDTLGDFEYQKRSGTGSTGWVVADGDTGSRNISASLENGWTGNVYLRRIGNTVELKGEGLNASLATSDTFYTLPTGFRANGSYPGTNRIGLAAAGSAMPSTRVTTGYSTGVTQIVSRGTTTNWDTGTMSWLTANAWPTVLPGA